MRSIIINYLSGLLLMGLLTFNVIGQEIPSVHSGFNQDDQGRSYLEIGGNRYYNYEEPAIYTLERLIGNPKGEENGLSFDFQIPQFGGKLYYGLIPYGDSKHPLPVYFRQYALIDNGKCSIDMGTLSGIFDMVGWEKTGTGTLGYRVVDSTGMILYDGKVTFKGTGPFEVDVTVIEGPFVNRVTHNQAVISFETNQRANPELLVNGKTFSGARKQTHHEIEITGLQPDRVYPYQLTVGSISYNYELKTAPSPGSRSGFSFAYASDSRSGQGGGERNVYGANFYIMKKIMALIKFKNAVFLQFTGDLINGYLEDKGEINLQYANWKRAIEPFAHYLPVYVSMGNHEALSRNFYNSENMQGASVDRFPFDTESAEAVFAQNFVNPHNGPLGEDGAIYDPNPDKIDFPPYMETVYYYIYDNIAVVVMNSHYWYSPTTNTISKVGGGLRDYIMDQQLEWFEKTISKFEDDPNIDHIFITQHSPVFPNGGHVHEAMWYRGNNQYRPFVAGKPMAKGIIERRDQLLDIAVNQSSKVIAILTGDEHNYAKTEVGPDTNIYPENYLYPKIELTRTIYQINNGAAGAPYYAQEQTPWSPFVTGFTTQHALVFFHINGSSVEMEVLNPDTLEEVDRLKLR